MKPAAPSPRLEATYRKGPAATIGVIAPSSQVPPIELALGVECLCRSGYTVVVHPQVRQSERFFSGTDQERADAFLEYALDPDIQILWGARGGYGAARILERLEERVRRSGIVPPRKLLIGFSDLTALMEFVRVKWNWSILHAPTLSHRSFSLAQPGDWRSLTALVDRHLALPVWAKKSFKFLTPAPAEPIEGLLVGGNLTVWQSLVGTPYSGSPVGSLIFFEDVGESLYRIERALQHLVMSGSLHGVLGIVLGEFTHCRDQPMNCLKKMPTERTRSRMLERPKTTELRPLRRRLNEPLGIHQIFREVGEYLQIPVLANLPVGHGPRLSPLPLGARYRLTPRGKIELLDWDWTSSLSSGT